MYKVKKIWTHDVSFLDIKCISCLDKLIFCSVKTKGRFRNLNKSIQNKNKILSLCLSYNTHI